MLNPYKKQSKSREATVLEYAPLVKHIANRLAARLPSSFQVDDLIQAGMIGLLEAMEKFDPQKGVLLKTFASIRIRGAMLDDLRSRDWIPRSVRDNGNRLEKAYSELRAQNIDHPTDKQLAKQLEVNTRELGALLDKSTPIPLLSLEALGSFGNDDDQIDILETISDEDDQSQITNLVDQESREKLVNAIKRLPENEQMVLSLYYTEDLNLKEIGAVLRVSESRVSQIRTKAIAMLRSYMRDYIEEE